MAAPIRDAATPRPGFHVSSVQEIAVPLCPLATVQPARILVDYMLADEDLAAQRAVAPPTWQHDDRVLELESRPMPQRPSATASHGGMQSAAAEV
jgi:hypothetical protein